MAVLMLRKLEHNLNLLSVITLEKHQGIIEQELEKRKNHKLYNNSPQLTFDYSSFESVLGSNPDGPNHEDSCDDLNI